MLQAMNTGHDGSLTTVHSNSPRDTLSRIETMTLMAGMDLPVRVIREQMASALDLDRAPRPPARRHPPRHPGERGAWAWRATSSCSRTSTRSTSRWASTTTASSAGTSRAPGSARRSPSGSPTTASRSTRRCSPTVRAVRRRPGGGPVTTLDAPRARRTVERSCSRCLLAAAVLAFALALLFMSPPTSAARSRSASASSAPTRRRDRGVQPVTHGPTRCSPRPRCCKRMVGLTGRLADRAGLLTAHRGRARAGRPAAAPARSAVLLLHRRLRRRAARRHALPARARADPRGRRRDRARSRCCTAGGRSACASSRCSCPTR